ncbi:hypothetical protein RvY_07045 [Ramazzottius varieornatus]|uniref:HAT C-terminal dimerisation domain-containing protein n=1 Tax=Ramazzottius varieornatus TaxID=947166 RepID=A0A1D1V0N4_RAMVA|nr:hypothetical protein RvY_07045 [Ramazzottius varieornatus]
MAHSWNNANGELIKNLPLLVKFLARVQKLFCHSGERKQQFKDFVMARSLHFTSPVFYCKTRWSSYLRSIRYWVKYIDEIEAFVEQLKVSGKVAKCLQYLREMFSNMDEKYKLLFQLRAIDHIGDRLEAELTKSRISSTFEGFLLDNELDPHAPAEGRTNGWTRKLWYTESKTQLVAALTAAKTKVDQVSKEHPESKFLMGVRIFELSQAVRMMGDREWTNVRDTILPKQGVTGISQIPMDEWRVYQKIAEEVMFINTENLDSFWRSHSKELPVLHAIALQNIWTPVNSVEVERCFSVINSFFGKKRYQMKKNNIAVLMSFAFNMRRLKDFDTFDNSLQHMELYNAALLYKKFDHAQ